MTGGQFSPTTPYGSFATTASYGNVEHAFNIAELAVTAGASFVARGTVYHTHQLDRLIEKAIKHSGFSVVEIMSNCHVQYGRRNKMPDPVTMIQGFKDHAVPVEKGREMSSEELAGKFTIGVLAEIDKPNYLEQYAKIRERAGKKSAVP
jgi:2-oxoglutarate ferredoxin oxidoreductase subunit beta